MMTKLVTIQKAHVEDAKHARSFAFELDTIMKHQQLHEMSLLRRPSE
jgi:hypothetical protein